MKRILISIKPKYVAKILNGEKTLEIRKSFPKCKLPCEVYIYCTSHKNYTQSLYEVCQEEGGGYEVDKYRPSEPDFILNGKVVAKFTLNKTYLLTKEKNGYVAWCGMPCFDPTKEACLTQDDFDKYLKGKDGYAWHIDNLVIFDRPEELKDFFMRDKKGDIPIQVEELKGSKFMALKRIEHAPQSYCYCEVEE